MYTPSPAVAEAQAVYEEAHARYTDFRNQCIAAKQALDTAVIEEHLDDYGVTAEQYEQAKLQSRAEDKPLGACLKAIARESRRKARMANRELQTVKAKVATVGVKAVNAKGEQ